MAVSIEDVKYIATLARLEFTENELDNLAKDMNEILGYMDKLNELDTENIEPLSYPIEKDNVFREDILKGSVTSESALMNAPDATEHFFKVPKVIKVNKTSNK
ncbi:glutamyl-tRNA(Gln) amidotransferase subunit C [bacterium BMS3Abin04]|nr:glutamyl-tRNA(Gln) amidotransferase subunit C [bacterium BMS3Abin04]